ncbi:MAG TPA: cytochrome b N-terminal domain-containing protein, partial [Rheinheimera sp.]|nr:cytochrome b N-terminal domain-containing protein [Rheinheimera sp.]
RFFALHVIALPLVLVILVFLHIMALHEVGSNNPDGIEVKRENDGSVTQTDADKKFTFHEYFTKGGKKIIVDAIPFHPYYTVKDLVGVAGFLLIFAWVIFFMPEGGGYFLEPPNFEAANPLKTPEHIAPVWYFTPFYAILRAVPDQLFGAIFMFLAIIALALLPWIDRGTVRSIRYRSDLHKVNLVVFCISFVALGVLGVLPATPTYTVLARIFSFTYFGYFALLWIYSKNEKTKPLPVRLS